jgi:hypothetical protein
MTEPLTDEEVDEFRKWANDPKASTVWAAPFNRAIARIDLERNRADEAVRERDSWKVSTDTWTKEAVIWSDWADAAEAEVARLREAERLLRWYVEDDLVEGGDAFGGWDDDVREFVEVAALVAPPTDSDEFLNAVDDFHQSSQ